MDDTSPAHERASVTAARWALGGATAALVALASGATALLVVTSTTGVGLPLEDSHPLPATSADGSRGSADVLLLPGGSQPSSGTRARRAGPGSDDLLLGLRSAASRSPATLTGLAARPSSGEASTPSPAGSSADDLQVLPVVEDARPEPGGTTPPAEEEPAGEGPAKGPGRTPDPQPRPDAPAEDDDDDKGKAKGKGADEKDDDESTKDKDDKEKDDKSSSAGHTVPALAGPAAEPGRPAPADRPEAR